MSQNRTSIVLLGTGNPNPDPRRSGPSIAIIVDGIPYIIDFGPGVIRQAAAMTPQYGGSIAALDIKNLKKAFLTHLHSDHTIGYPDLILTPWVMGRTTPLDVFGPEGTNKLTRHILQAYQEDINHRIDGLEPANHDGWKVNVHEITEGMIYTDENVQVEAFLVNHGNWTNAYGYKFTTPDKAIVISGDTAPCKNIRKFSYGVDILLHEVYSYKRFTQLNPIWQNYHANYHTSTHELGILARETRPGLLVTYHNLFWGSSDQEILNEIRSVYDGTVVIGHDFQLIE